MCQSAPVTWCVTVELVPPSGDGATYANWAPNLGSEERPFKSAPDRLVNKTEMAQTCGKRTSQHFVPVLEESRTSVTGKPSVISMKKELIIKEMGCKKKKRDDNNC